MKVKEAMHKGVTWFSPDTPVAKIAKRMRKEDIGAVPIGEDDRLVGMVTDRDICCRGLGNGRDIEKLTARDVMSKPIYYCHDDQSVQEAMRIMEKSQVRRLPVINSKKRMVGILSLGDISRAERPTSVGSALKSLTGHHA